MMFWIQNLCPRRHHQQVVITHHTTISSTVCDVKYIATKSSERILFCYADGMPRLTKENVVQLVILALVSLLFITIIIAIIVLFLRYAD